jgi:hypothetical protein
MQILDQGVRVVSASSSMNLQKEKKEYNDADRLVQQHNFILVQIR